MVNNFDKISQLLDFSVPGTFYFLQILKRRKENPDLKTGSQVVDNFYIYTENDLEKLKDKIIERCMKHNARAYINLNRLDLQKIAMYTVKQSMDYIILGDYKSVKNAYANACGSHHSEKTKRWIVDIDEENLSQKEEITNLIVELQAEVKKSKYEILAEIPTVSGMHVITNPFNMEKFRTEMEKRGIQKIDVQKNSPTLLFYANESTL